METNQSTKVTVQTVVQAPIEKVWKYWTEPVHIMKWNQASDDWHAPRAENDLRAGGKFVTRMEAKDGSMGFDFGGVYDTVKRHEEISYTMEDGRKVEILFVNQGGETKVVETFDAESTNPVEFQQAGWQAIMDNFKRYTEQSITVKLTPYITLEGRAKEAIQFYQEVIGAEVLSMVTYGEMPDMPSTFNDEMKNLVAHAKLKVGDTELMLSDTPMGSPLGNEKRVTICITTSDVEHSRLIYEALRQDGQVNLPFKEEPFSPGFGDVTDKFGVTFQIYTEIG